jgi:transmembrane sensor
MKKKINIGRFTDSEWAELASLLSGERNEKTSLLDRFMADDNHQAGEKWKELNRMSSDKEINVDKAWNSVYSRINKDSIETTESNTGKSRLRITLMRIAAIALIILSLGITTTYLINSGTLSKKITVNTGYDQKNLPVSLPDGSKIFLNRNSELSYSSDFGRRGRNVKLTGEAFFDISPDVSKPFIIDAGMARVKVVGTSFNVITKNRESEVEVYVKTGKVIVSSTSGSQTLQLDPGFVGTINTKISGKKVNSNPNYLAWNTGHLVYNGQKLDVVFNDLKRVYDMDIVADDPGILENRWTSPIDNQSQVTIIRLICASFNLSYTMDGNVYHLSKK